MLKYLFIARYNDGTEYKQNEIDKSVKEPDKRSCFFDIEHDKLVEFELTDYKNTQYIVNLTNGNIQIITKYSTVLIPTQYKNLTNFRIIYFRKVEQAINCVFPDGSTNRVTAFVLGWQANDEYGHNVKQIIEIV